jgi:hypothetical protein
MWLYGRIHTQFHFGLEIVSGSCPIISAAEAIKDKMAVTRNRWPQSISNP